MIVTLSSLVMLCSPHVNPVTMRAIVQVESAGNPYAVSINYPRTISEAGFELPSLQKQPRSLETALRLVVNLGAQGLQTSVGLAQINSANGGRFGMTVRQLFDPCTNLRVAQRLLIECDHLQGSLNRLAGPRLRLERTLSCYNSGDFHTGLENGYVANVELASWKPVASKP